MDAGEGGQDPPAGIGQDSYISSGKLVPVETNDFVHIDRALKVQGPGYRCPGFLRYVPEEGKNFRNGDGKFASSGVSGDFKMMPFEDMR